MVEYLQHYSDLITLFFTIAVGISTIIYAFLTKKLVDETRRMRKSQTDPELSISLVQNEISISLIDLQVENIGMGPAYDIKFKVTKDYEMKKRMFSDIGFIKNGIRYFAPKQKLTSFIASFVNDPDELSKQEIEISVTYKNAIDELFERSYILSFSQYSSLIKIGTPPLHSIASNIEKIRYDLNSVINGFRRINTNMFDSIDRQKENEETEKQFEEYRKKNKIECNTGNSS